MIIIKFKILKYLIVGFELDLSILEFKNVTI